MIGYIFEPDDWSRGIEVESLEALVEFVKGCAPFVDDAEASLPKTEKDFAEFREGLKKERSGEYAGDEWVMKYGALDARRVMP